MDATATRQWFRGLWLLVLGTLSGCGPDLYLMHAIESRGEGEDWLHHGGGCQRVGGGGGSSGGSGGGGDSFGTSLQVRGDRAVFTVVVRGELVERRVFDEDFLASGDMAVVTIDLPDGRRERHSFWGGRECQSPRTFLQEQGAADRARAGQGGG